MTKTALIIFAREPREGVVKTRLGPDLPASTVLALYKAFIRDVAAEALKASAHARFIFYDAGEEPVVFLEEFKEHFKLKRQEGVTLGERMHHTFRHCRKQGFNRMIIIGTDCVTISAKDINEAFGELEGHDCVLGPSLDGGYYLIGLQEPEEELFTGIEWGTSKVLAQTIQKTGDLRKITFLLREEMDVDTPGDLRELSRRVEGTDIAPCTQEATRLLPARNHPAGG
jgi:rSAM/selenodomain-associated transferase 1